MYRRRLIVAMLTLIAAAGCPAFAQGTAQSNKLNVVATFSILGDLVREVGGDRIALTTLVGANGDAHVYSPTPADARTVGQAKLVFVNGLGLEGWLPRLAGAGKKVTVVASDGVRPVKEGSAHGHSHGHGHSDIDPHAWQSVANVKIYVRNIAGALAKADPAGKADYEANAASYLEKLDALDREIKDAVARIPADRRKIITTHDAFGYFAKAYGIRFISPAGVSTEAEVSAKNVARIISQIRREKIPAVFLENVSDPRLIQQIARETGARIGGTLYSDALSDKDGPAATYLDMMRNNVRQFSSALTG